MGPIDQHFCKRCCAMAVCNTVVNPANLVALPEQKTAVEVAKSRMHALEHLQSRAVYETCVNEDDDNGTLM